MIHKYFAHFAIVVKDGLFYLALWRHHSWFQREHEVLALWRHVRRLFLRAQIGAKGIFTTVNIDFSPPGIHGLACKKSFLS